MRWWSRHHSLLLLIRHQNPGGMSQCHAMPRLIATRLRNVLIEFKLPDYSIWAMPRLLESLSTKPKHFRACSPKPILVCHVWWSTTARWIGQIVSYLVSLCKTPAHTMGFRPAYRVLPTYRRQSRQHWLMANSGWGIWDCFGSPLVSGIHAKINHHLKRLFY